MSYKSYKLIFGNIGFKSIVSGYLTSKQLVLIKKIFSKKLKKIGLFWIKVYPFFNVTKKPAEVRMGRGKGNVHEWVCPIRIGQIVFEFKNISRKDVNDLYKICNNKYLYYLK